MSSAQLKVSVTCELLGWRLEKLPVGPSGHSGSRWHTCGDLDCTARWTWYSSRVHWHCRLLVWACFGPAKGWLGCVAGLAICTMCHAEGPGFAAHHAG